MEEDEFKIDFDRLVSEGKYYQMLCTCTECEYKWKTRKKRSLPPRCPSCGQATVTVRWEDNEDDIIWWLERDNY